MDHGTDILELANGLKAQGEAFVLATVVRTVAATAAKAGVSARRTVRCIVMASLLDFLVIARYD